MVSVRNPAAAMSFFETFNLPTCLLQIQWSLQETSPVTRRQKPHNLYWSDKTNSFQHIFGSHMHISSWKGSWTILTSITKQLKKILTTGAIHSFYLKPTQKLTYLTWSKKRLAIFFCSPPLTYLMRISFLSTKEGCWPLNFKVKVIGFEPGYSLCSQQHVLPRCHLIPPAEMRSG